MERRNNNSGKGKFGNSKSGGGSRSGGRQQSDKKSYYKKKATPQKKGNPDEIRLNKYIANAGICSRREADTLIIQGLITVNGKVATEMGYKVKLTDDVRYDGARINPEKKQYILLNKPKSFATVPSGDRFEKTAMGLISNATRSERVLPVGKLERSSMGLILFTNDGDLSRKLVTLRGGIKALYHVVLNKKMMQSELDQIKEGVKTDDGMINVDEISFVDGKSKNEVGIKIRAGKHGTIRRLFEHLGYEIVIVDRVVFAGLTKKDLPRGNWRHLSQEEINLLKML